LYRLYYYEQLELLRDYFIPTRIYYIFRKILTNCLQNTLPYIHIISNFTEKILLNVKRFLFLDLDIDLLYHFKEINIQQYIEYILVYDEFSHRMLSTLCS